MENNRIRQGKLMMNKSTALFWLKVIWSVQILVGIICVCLTFQAVYFKNPLHNFVATKARTEKDLTLAIPDFTKGKANLIDAITEEMTSLQAQSLAFASLLFLCTPFLIILSSLNFFIINANVIFNGFIPKPP